MNLLDENFPEDQTPLLKEWRIPFRQIGRDVARRGIKDSAITMTSTSGHAPAPRFNESHGWISGERIGRFQEGKK